MATYNFTPSTSERNRYSGSDRKYAHKLVYVIFLIFYNWIYWELEHAFNMFLNYNLVNTNILVVVLLHFD